MKFTSFDPFFNPSRQIFLKHRALMPTLGLSFSILLYINNLSVVWVLFFVPIVSGWKLFLTYILPFLALSYGALYLYMGHLPPPKPEKGMARIHIQEVRLSTGTFGKSWVYKGMINRFESESGKIYKRVPFTLYFPSGQKRVLANCDYLVSGWLKKSDFYGARLKIERGTEFRPVPKTWSMAEVRYHLKKRFKKLLTAAIPYKYGRTLLIGMSTGDFEDRYLAYTFSRFGLNHLLAISGFHFALLAIFLSFITRPMGERPSVSFIALLLTLFYLFVGNGPSLQRAWIVAMVYLGARFFKQIVTSINILAFSMLIILLLNPYMISHLGFQFSFMVTFSILVFYPPLNRFFKTLLLPESFLDRTWVQSVALGCAVHLAAVPLSLYHFHKFYWMGFFYNMGVPLLVSAILFIFMAGTSIYLFIPKWGAYFWKLAGYSAHELIRGLYEIPTTYDFCLRIGSFPSSCLAIYWVCFFFVGAYYQRDKEILFLNRYLII